MAQIANSGILEISSQKMMKLTLYKSNWIVKLIPVDRTYYFYSFKPETRIFSNIDSMPMLTNSKRTYQGWDKIEILFRE